jgi:hypothetical protein
MLYFSILLHYHKSSLCIPSSYATLFIGFSSLFIYTHYMFRPSYKAIFRWIVFEPVLVTLVTNIHGSCTIVL